MRSPLALKHPQHAQTITRGVMCLLICTLVACPDTTTAPPPVDQGGSISGSISLGVSLTSQRLRSSAALNGVIPGRVIIKRKTNLQPLGSSSLNTSNLNASSLTKLRTPGVNLNLERELGNGAGVYRATGLNAGLSSQATIDLAAKLSAQAGVEYAEPDRIVHTSDIAPTDSRFGEQWNLQAPSGGNPSGLNLPAAWQVSTGKPGVVIAVIDTGILGKTNDPSKTHPEFTGRVLPGFDFVSDLFLSNDGDARDADAFDPGDAKDGTGEYHGSHVAGIAAANLTTISSTPNTSTGMVGVAPNASILPVRALGVGGDGSLSDVLEAMLWAAGSNVTGAAVNAHPADVLNLSLGDTGACSRATQDTINTVLARPQRPVIVVAAGNDNIDSSNAFPANCEGVIGVGALNQKGDRASYSNYGAFVDVMAPGGDFNASGKFDAQSAILGAWWDANGKTFSYQFDAGTSMAAPHISGLIALIKSVATNPADINTGRTLEVLRASGTPLSATACKRSSGSACGVGLIDTTRVLGFAAGTIPLPNTDPFALQPVQAALNLLPGASSDLELRFERAAGFNAAIAITATSSNPDVTATVTSASITSDLATLKLEVNKNAKSGEADITIQASTDQAVAGGFKLERIVRVTIPPERTLTSSFVIALALNPDGTPNTTGSRLENATPAGNTGLAATLGSFAFKSLEPGRYLIVGLKDVNQNRTIDAGDYLGSYTEDAINSSVIKPPKQDADLDLEAFSSSAPSLSSYASLTAAQRAAVNTLLITSTR
jgi:serine protease